MSTSAKPTQVKVSVDPETAAAFKVACAANGESMASAITRFMADYSGRRAGPRAAPDYSTRRRRRSAIRAIVGQLEQMRAWEERVYDNTPENLQGTDAHAAAEEAADAIENAIDALSEFWMVP